MAPKISVESDYILIEPQEIEFWEMWEAVGRLFKMPEYLDKPTIWLFSDKPLNIAYSDLYRLKDFISKHYPKGAKKVNKTAIVVTTGLHLGLAKSFANIAKDLPFEIRIFSEFPSAQYWITE